jgi:hypothetical protein
MKYGDLASSRADKRGQIEAYEQLMLVDNSRTFYQS